MQPFSDYCRAFTPKSQFATARHYYDFLAARAASIAYMAFHDIMHARDGRMLITYYTRVSASYANSFSPPKPSWRRRRTPRSWPPMLMIAIAIYRKPICQLFTP